MKAGEDSEKNQLCSASLDVATKKRSQWPRPIWTLGATLNAVLSPDFAKQLPRLRSPLIVTTTVLQVSTLLRANLFEIHEFIVIQITLVRIFTLKIQTIPWLLPPPIQYPIQQIHHWRIRYPFNKSQKTWENTIEIITVMAVITAVPCLKANLMSFMVAPNPWIWIMIVAQCTGAVFSTLLDSSISLKFMDKLQTSIEYVKCKKSALLNFAISWKCQKFKKYQKQVTAQF